ncbi:MAG: hypothetical protein IRY85_13120 [Micromonosporaceae bacterium]|nr:hypothetical protein [Micromonosporaceae bacterium]
MTTTSRTPPDLAEVGLEPLADYLARFVDSCAAPVSAPGRRPTISPRVDASAGWGDE